MEKLVTQGAATVLPSRERFRQLHGRLTGGQAVQQVKAGIQAIYLSGWQVAADNNSAESMYPDQSLYPVDSVPNRGQAHQQLVPPRRPDPVESSARTRATRVTSTTFAPIVADAEAGFGGVLNAYELMKSMIQQAPPVCSLQDQLLWLKKCGHMASKLKMGHPGSRTKLTAARPGCRRRGHPDHRILARHRRQCGSIC